MTQWGRGPAWWKQEVQDYFYQNARMYFEDYRADGLRFDATRQINWENPALRADSLTIPHEDPTNQVLGFVRQLYDNILLIVVNLSEQNFIWPAVYQSPQVERRDLRSKMIACGVSALLTSVAQHNVAEWADWTFGTGWFDLTKAVIDRHHYVGRTVGAKAPRRIEAPSPTDCPSRCPAG
jgi:hypothetical protein